MGRSNNQRRRTCKDKGLVFIPKMTKSVARNHTMKQRIDSKKARFTGGTGAKKLAYSKVINKKGMVKSRKFRAGGYNSSGKHGKAQGAKSMGNRKNRD